MPTDGHASLAGRVVSADSQRPRAVAGISRESGAERARLFCLVGGDHADVLLSPLRDHFARQPLVDVRIERRIPNLSALDSKPSPLTHRRAPVAERDASRVLPSALRHEAPHLRLVQPLAPLRRVDEGTDTAALIVRTAALEPAATSELWWRFSPRTLARLALRLGHAPDEEAARTLLGRILDELPGYDPLDDPLSAWLDAVVDRYAEERAAAASSWPPRSSRDLWLSPPEVTPRS